MTRGHQRIGILILFTMVAVAVAAPGAGPQQPNEQQQQLWDAGTHYPDWSAPSSLDIVNECKHTHSFAVSKENVTFLDFLGETQLRVGGHKTATLPVRFHTDGMAPGDYLGRVIVLCLDCTEVPPCVQDKKVLPVHVTVAPRPGTPTGETTPTQETKPTTPTTPETRPQIPTSPPCQATAKSCDQLRQQMEEAQKAADKASRDYFAAMMRLHTAWLDAVDDCDYAQEGENILKEQRERNRSNPNWKPSPEFLRELDLAWYDCYESTQRFYAAYLIAQALAVANDSAQSALAGATNAFEQCRDELLKYCDFKLSPPKLDYNWGGTRVSEHWPKYPPVKGSEPAGGEKKKPEWPKTPGTETGGVKTTSGTGGHPITQSKPPCPVTADDCEKLRLAWQQKEAEAKAAQANAHAAKAEAERTAKLAADADKAAAAAAAAVPTLNEGSGWMESNGKRLTSLDLQLENEASKQALADFQAGKISADQLQEIWGRWGDTTALAKLRKEKLDKIEEARKKAKEAAQAAAAAHAVAAGAKSTAEKAQQAADKAKADAEAARLAYEECMKKLAECQQSESGGGGGGKTGEGGGKTTEGGAGGGGTGTGAGGVKTTGGQDHTHTVSGCPPFPEDCDKLKARWEELKNAAALVQAVADQAKANQSWNNSQADYLDQEAAKDKAFADGQTERAKQWRELAGARAALAERERQYRDQYPAGSASWNFWNNEANLDDQETAERNRTADEMEATEQKYAMQAAATQTQAAQLRSNASDAQAKADQAKADADAAYKAWQDCLERKRQYEEECKKKTATGGTPGTTGGPATGGTGGGGTPGTTPGGGKPGTTGGQPGGTTPNPVKPDDTGIVCTPTFFKEPHGELVIGLPRSGGKLEFTHVNEPLTKTGGFTYHCKGPGTFTVIYDTDTGRHTVKIECTP